MKYNGLEERHVFTLTRGTQLVLERQGTPDDMASSRWYVRLIGPAGELEGSQEAHQPLEEAGLVLMERSVLDRLGEQLLRAAMRRVDGQLLEALGVLWGTDDAETRKRVSHLAQDLKK